MPGVPGGNPEIVVCGDRTDEREHVLRQREDPGPAVADARLAVAQLAEEALERRLDRRRGLLHVGQLVHDRDVAEPAEEQPPVRELLPVIESLARVVRTVVEHAVERFAHDDLAARGPQRVGELGQKGAAVAVGGNEHALRIECIDVLDG